jgi:hypothetical protein
VFFLREQSYSLAVADFNVDGRLDILAADQTDNAISVLPNLGVDYSTQFRTSSRHEPVGVACRFDASGNRMRSADKATAT